MPPQSVFPDDGTLAYAMEYAASRMSSLKLTPAVGSAPQEAGKAFFRLGHEEKSELCLTLYSVVTRYYREHAPTPEQLAEWDAIRKQGL